MAKDQACKLQILSAKHPGMLLAVDKMFDKFTTRLQVVQMIEREYHEDVGMTAISNYKVNHYNVQQSMIREQKAAMKGVSQLVGEDGLTAGVNALLWQELQTMTPTQLMSFKKICNDTAKVTLLKKQFALYAQEHRQKMKERSMQAEKGKVEIVDDFDAARRMVEQAKEIFGIGTTAYDPPVRKILGPAEKPTAPTAVIVNGVDTSSDL